MFLDSIDIWERPGLNASVENLTHFKAISVRGILCICVFVILYIPLPTVLEAFEKSKESGSV